MGRLRGRGLSAHPQWHALGPESPKEAQPRLCTCSSAGQLAEAKVERPSDHTAQSLEKGMGKLRQRDRAEPWPSGPPVPLLGSPVHLATHPLVPRTEALGTQLGRASGKGPQATDGPNARLAPGPGLFGGWGPGAAGSLQAPHCLQPHPFFLDRKGWG